jgi:chromosome segregation ATPase
MALEQKLQKLQLDMEEQVAVLTERENRARVEDASIVETEAQLRDSKKEMERYLKDYEKLFQETQRLTEQLESLMYSNETTENENEVRRRDVSAREKNVNVLKSESSQLNRAKDVVLKKLAAVEQQRETWEQEREDLRARIAQLSTLEIRAAWREGEAYKKQLEDLGREREILSRKLGSSEKTAQLIFDLTKVNQNAKKNLQNEVNGYTATVKLQREQIESLVQDRERHEQEANAASRKYYVALEQLKLQEVQISDLQRKIIDGGARLKQQQNLYEAVRSDRNLYSKNLIQSQEEIAEMKRRFKIMNHQIEQLKEEITVKDHSLVKEHFNHHNVDKERESLKNELTKIRKQIVSSEQIISNQRAEIQKLSQIIREADEERQRQHKEHEAIVGERNILSSQLIRRNEELAAVYEKMKINWSSLQRGETRFAECAAEVQFLVERIQEMRRERDDSALQMTSIHELRYTLHALESDLLQERNKIKALNEELERPLNVHRWRMLESSDPQRFEMIKKIQGLQKRIIQKTEDVFEKEARIQEKERLYVELKNILGRQPGPEVAEQLALYHTSLREKNVQMKAMTAELDMYKQQVAEFRSDIDELARDLDTIKEEWLQKRLFKEHPQPVP